MDLYRIKEELSDNFTIKWKILIINKKLNKRSYITYSANLIIKDYEDPNIQNNYNLLKEDLVASKRTIRPVILIQYLANSIISTKIDWNEKLIKLNDLTKADFQ